MNDKIRNALDNILDELTVSEMLRVPGVRSGAATLFRKEIEEFESSHPDHTHEEALDECLDDLGPDVLLAFVSIRTRIETFYYDRAAEAVRENR